VRLQGDGISKHAKAGCISKYRVTKQLESVVAHENNKCFTLALIYACALLSADKIYLSILTGYGPRQLINIYFAAILFTVNNFSRDIPAICRTALSETFSPASKTNSAAETQL
jgi:hypothetical protein